MHTHTLWDILWQLWVNEHLLVVRLFPSRWHKPSVTQGDQEPERTAVSKKKKKRHRKLWEDSTYNRRFFSESLNQTKQCLLVFKKKRQPNVCGVAFHLLHPRRLLPPLMGPKDLSGEALTGCFESSLQSSFTSSRAGVLGEPDDFWHPDKQMFRGHE